VLTTYTDHEHVNVFVLYPIVSMARSRIQNTADTAYHYPVVLSGIGPCAFALKSQCTLASNLLPSYYIP
jgi:hypothetical protein